MSSLSIGQMNQLSNAFEAAGWNKGLVTKLGQSGRLADIKALLEGHAEISVVKHVIDCDANPLIPYDGWKVEEHKKGGQLAFNPTKIKLHLSPNQQAGKTIKGDKLRKELSTEPVLNANVLDYLLNNPHLIPEEWKADEQNRTRYIFFWGTIYRHSVGYLYVRCLYCFGVHWRAGFNWLDDGFVVQYPAAVSAS